jgi:hypothetical protein
VVPGLFSAPGELRLAALELLLARGRGSEAESVPLEQWLPEAFGLDDEPLAAGALTVLAEGGEPGDARWARADPMHLRVLQDRVMLVPNAGFSVSREEAEALCEALNEQMSGILTLHPLHPERWCARLEEPLAIEAGTPLAVAGQNADAHLPRTAEAKRVHALLNEMQMVLHGHPVNEAREARGDPAVNSVWLWGEGTRPERARSPWQSVAAEEPIARGLARLAGVRTSLDLKSAEAWLDRLPEEGRHLAVLDALRAPLALEDAAALAERLRVLEAQWFEPLLAMLRAGRIGMVTIHVPDGAAAVSFEVVRSDLRRFWRRPKALEHYT